METNYISTTTDSIECILEKLSKEKRKNSGNYFRFDTKRKNNITKKVPIVGPKFETLSLFPFDSFPMKLSKKLETMILNLGCWG